MAHVAPLAGSVDRNCSLPPARSHSLVAPLAGSVDRNHKAHDGFYTLSPSLPSRGAWIEILQTDAAPRSARVAPLAGSVDRNCPVVARNMVLTVSLPSRGAWIEICCMAVARWPLTGRSPRGERG